jgi:hypothetical protein
MKFDSVSALVKCQCDLFLLTVLSQLGEYIGSGYLTKQILTLEQAHEPWNGSMNRLVKFRFSYALAASSRVLLLLTALSQAGECRGSG